MDWQGDARNTFEDLINSHKASQVKAYKLIKPVRIKIDGEYFITPKGKSLWTRLAHAKAALRMHLTIDYRTRSRNIDWREYGNFCEELYQEFLRTRVEFEYV